MKRILKVMFFAIAKIVVTLLIGLRIQHQKRLPIKGPAILVANHNSHLDTIVLTSLFPLEIVHQLRPLASKQYFLERNPWLAWFSRYVLDIIPVSIKPEKGVDAGDARPKSAAHRSFLADCDAALAQNQILILYPEGSRGEPECLSEFKCGIAYLAKRYPQVPIVPIFLHGLGKALPKGEFLLVPFLCRVCVGSAIYWNGQKQAFLDRLTAKMKDLSTAN
jgi:1-acyl-sn-glycerol-3-phosphate acyltransferase